MVRKRPFSTNTSSKPEIQEPGSGFWDFRFGSRRPSQARGQFVKETADFLTKGANLKTKDPDLMEQRRASVPSAWTIEFTSGLMD